MQKIDIQYKGQTRPAKAGVDKGSTTLVLTPEYYEDIYKKIFSPDFLAVPNSNDITNFARNKKITWTIENDNAEAVSSINDSISEKLDKQKYKLVDKRKELESKKKLTQGEKDHLEILSQFGFNWDNPKSEYIYSDGENLTILSWGMTDDKGDLIPPPPPSPDPPPVKKEINGDNGKNLPPPPPPPVLPPEPSFLDKVKERYKKQEWKRTLLISLLIIVLLLLLKNCNPVAKISYEQHQDAYLFNSFGSHDKTSFWSRGLLSETSSEDLQSEWKFSDYDETVNDFTVNEYGNSNESKAYGSEIGRTFDPGTYRAILKVTDSGNRLGFFNRSDQDTAQVTRIHTSDIDTIVFELLSEYYGLGSIPFLDDDGDGWSNYIEDNITGTDCQLHDTDGDGISDFTEGVNGLNPLMAIDAEQDPDNDGETSKEEIEKGTDPFQNPLADDDGDGITNEREENYHNTDPTNPDTDGDGVDDGDEVKNNTDPNDPENKNTHLPEDDKERSDPYTSPVPPDDDDLIYEWDEIIEGSCTNGWEKRKNYRKSRSNTKDVIFRIIYMDSTGEIQEQKPKECR